MTGNSDGHADLSERDAGFKRYSDWEIGFVAQFECEGDLGIRLIEPAWA
jgi:hypothetical protein